jgi:hypothetical protein
LNYPNPNLYQQQLSSTPSGSPFPNTSSNSYFPTSSTTNSSSTTVNNARTVNGNTPRVGSGTNTPASNNESDQVNINLTPGMEDTLFTSLKDLFWKISQNKKKSGVIAPINFITKVKKENGKNCQQFCILLF